MSQFSTYLFISDQPHSMLKMRESSHIRILIFGKTKIEKVFATIDKTTNVVCELADQEGGK